MGGWMSERIDISGQNRVGGWADGHMGVCLHGRMGVRGCVGALVGVYASFESVCVCEFGRGALTQV